VKADTIEACREFCYATEGCEGVVFGEGMCYGKKDIRTSQCPLGDGEYITELLTDMPFGTCSLMGDPHILTFDDPNGEQATQTTQTTPGDYYLVLADDLEIQGRFGYSERFPSAASLQGIAVYGDIIQKNKLVVEYVGPAQGPTGFRAYWNSEEILTGGIGATYTSKDGFLTASLNNMDPQTFNQEARSTIGGTSGDLPSYLFKIAPSIQIYVLMGEETMNGVITMRKLKAPMQGYCGNFNCVAVDDTIDVLKGLGLAGSITLAKSLFQDAPAPPASALKKVGSTPQLNDCSSEMLTKADEACKTLKDGFKESCVFDYCASGGSETGSKQDVAAAAVAINSAAATQMFGWFSLPLLSRVEVPGPLQLCLAVFIAGLAAVGMFVGVSSRRRSASAVTFTDSRAALSEEEDEEALLLTQRPASEHEPLLA